MQRVDRYDAQEDRSRKVQARVKKTIFLNNARAVALLLPCWLVLVAIIGRLAIAAALLAALATFVLDGMGLRILAVQVPIFVMAVLNFAQLFTGSFLIQQSIWYIFLLCQNAIVIAITAAWISLQFPWIHELAPDLVMLPRACERTVFAGLPFPSAALLTWALLPIAGTDAAPFVFTGLIFICYAVCVLPMASSFASSPPKNAAKAALDEPDSVVLSRFDTALNTFAMIFTPSIFYLLWHSYNITSLRVVEAVALLAAPFVFLRVCSKFTNPYWFLGIREPNSSAFVRISSLLSMSIVVSAMQIYVLAGPLGDHVVLPEPWNYVALALAFYSIVVLFEVFTGGIGSASSPDGAAPELSSSDSKTRRISYVAGVVAALSSSVALGLPLYIIPAPVLGSISAVSFCWKPRMSKYLVFTATLAVGLLWFILTKLWFIDFEFLLWNLSLRSLCILALVAFVLSVLIPGVVATQYYVLSGLMLLGQASLISFLEGILFYEPGVAYYPWYMIIMTSCLGMVAVWRLGTENRITKPARWIVCSLYAAKLSILLQPLDWAVPASFFIIAPFLRVAVFWFNDRTEPMSRTEAFYYSGMGVFGGFISKFTLVPRIWDLWGLWVDSDFVYWGSALLVAAMIIAPISWKHVPDFKLIRLIAVSMASAGAALILIFQPTAAAVFEGRFGVFDYILTSPAATYGLGLFGIPLFLAATGTIELASSLLMRILFILCTGSGAGLVVTKFALPDHFGRTPIFILVTFVTLLILTVTFLVFAQTGDDSTDMSAILVNSYIGIFACGIILYFLEGALAHLNSHELQNFRIVVLGILALINISVAIWLNFFVPQKHRSAGTMRARLPLVANIAVLLGFAIAVYLNITFLKGSEGSIFVLAPILLLRRRSGDALASPFWFPSVVITFILYAYTIFWIFVAPALRLVKRGHVSASDAYDPTIIWRGMTEEGYALTSDLHVSGVGLLLEIVVALCQLPALLSFNSFLRRPLLKHNTGLFAKIAFVLIGLAGFFAASIPSVRYLALFAAATVLLRLVAPDQIS